MQPQQQQPMFIVDGTVPMTTDSPHQQQQQPSPPLQQQPPTHHHVLVQAPPPMMALAPAPVQGMPGGHPNEMPLITMVPAGVQQPPAGAQPPPTMAGSQYGGSGSGSGSGYGSSSVQQFMPLPGSVPVGWTSSGVPQMLAPTYPGHIPQQQQAPPAHIRPGINHPQVMYATPAGGQQQVPPPPPQYAAGPQVVMQVAPTYVTNNTTPPLVPSGGGTPTGGFQQQQQTMTPPDQNAAARLALATRLVPLSEFHTIANRPDLAGMKLVWMSGVCKEHLSSGCRHGAQCQFLHLPPNIRPFPDQSCRDFNRTGTNGSGCQRAHCRFYHGAEEYFHAATRTITQAAQQPKAIFIQTNGPAPSPPPTTTEELFLLLADPEVLPSSVFSRE